MIDKFVTTIDAAIAGVHNGASIMIGGFGAVGQPHALVNALAARELKDLTIIANNAGGDFGGLPKLIAQGKIRKVVCSYPRATTKSSFDEMYAAGKIELELVPQGTLAERIRAACAGIPAFFTPTGAGTLLAEGKETRNINGKLCVMEFALPADFALIEAWQADRWGNLTYRLSGRNFNQVMAGAANITIASTHHRCELGELNPDCVITPGVLVDRVFLLPPEIADET